MPLNPPLHRRTFLSLSAAFALEVATPRPAAAAADERRVMTVTGCIPADRLGFTLPHEHVLVDFVGPTEVGPHRYDRDAVIEVVQPHLEQIHQLGVRTLVEATPAYIGRDARLLRQLAEATGLNLLTNTGYYGAVDDRLLPPHAFDETADQIADRWVREWEQGIDDTDIRPGFIKIGVDAGELSQVDRKLVVAAARAHRRTGLPIMAHTGPARPAMQQIDQLKREHVDPAAWTWTHAQAEPDKTQHVQAAREGAWVAFDGLSEDNVPQYVNLLTNMKDHDLLDRVLLSHDAGWYTPGEPGGGSFRGYDALARHLLPALRDRGFTEAQIEQLTVTNPAAAFTLGVREG